MPRRMYSAAAPGADSPSTQRFALLSAAGCCGATYLLWKDSERNHKQREQPVSIVVDAQVQKRIDAYIVRPKLVGELKSLLSPSRLESDNFFLSITGNCEAGKTELLRHVLEGRKGVLVVTLKKDDVDVYTAIQTQIGAANDDAAIIEALKEAKNRLGLHPIVVIDIPAGITGATAILSVSTFAKTFCYDERVCKVVVVASTAATADRITGDRRKINFFVPQFSLQEWKTAEAKAVLEHWYKNPVDETVIDKVFDLAGGNVGRFKAILVDASERGLASACASQEWCTQDELQHYESIDMQGGFGPEKVRRAGWLAHKVAQSSFEQCFPSSGASVFFSPTAFGDTARKFGTHPIYFDANLHAYCARSPYVHRQLRSIKFGFGSRKWWF